MVRNGGFLDDNSFRQVIQPNSELTYTGLWSIDHPYPASQRYFKVSAAQNADSNEVINVPTKDGHTRGAVDELDLHVGTHLREVRTGEVGFVIAVQRGR